MSMFSKIFKSDTKVSPNESQINNAQNILQNISLSDDDHIGALTKLKAIFLTTPDKDELTKITQTILRTATNDKSFKVREGALTTLDSIIEHSLASLSHSPQLPGPRMKLNIVSGSAVPVLVGMTKYKSEDAQALRRMAFWTLSKVAPFEINDERIVFLARNLGDTSEEIRLAVISAFENLVRSSDDSLKRRIARFSLSALCDALSDPKLWVQSANTLGGLGTYGLGAAPFLFKRLDDQDGEKAASALRNITGEKYGDKDKQKWEKWMQQNVVQPS